MLSLLALSSCRDNDLELFQKSPGHYDGFVMRSDSKTYAQAYLAAELKVEQPRVVSVEAQAVEGTGDLSGQWKFTIEVESGHDLYVSSSLWGNQRERIRFQKDWCFLHPKELPQQREIWVCYDGSQLSVEFQDAEGPKWTFVLTKFIDGDHPKPEDPADFTLDAIRNRAKLQSYTIKEQFERVVRARLQSENAYAALLPSLKPGTVLGFVTFQWTNLISAAGNLVPFLLPNRWFKAAASDFQSDGERFGWLAMRADTALLSEGTALAILRDEESAKKMETYLKPLTQIRDDMKDREELGLLPVGSSDTATVVLTGLQKTLTLMNQGIKTEYASLSQSLGFNSPAAVRSVSLPEAFAVTKPVDLQEDMMRRLVIERSLELRQLRSFIEQAKDENTACYFDWLDPAGAGNLGPGAPSYLDLCGEKVHDAELKLQDVRTQVNQKLDQAFTALKGTLESYRIASESLKVQSRRLQRILDQFELGIPISLTDYQLVVQDQLRAELDEINLRYTYEAAVSNLNRLLFVGPYLDLRPEPAPEETKKP